MINRKKYLFLIVIFTIMITIIGVSSKVFAFELTPELVNQDSESRKITVLLNVYDLSEYEDGINVASGKLIYDNNVFEEVTFEGTNGWTGAFNNNHDSDKFCTFMLITTTGNVKEEQEIASINLKVKDNVNNVRTKIKLENIETSYESETIKGQDKELKIDITDKSIKLSEENLEKLTKNVEKDKEKNYNMYIIIFSIVIILIMFLILIIKIQKKRREK